AVTLIMEAADDNAEIIFGTVIDDTLEENVKVTVIATGLGGQQRVKSTPKLEIQESKNTRPNISRPVEELSVPTKEVRQAAEAAQEETKARPAPKAANSESEISPLVKSIREAANRYETAKRGKEPAEPDMSLEMANEVLASTKTVHERNEGNKNNGRARSIAEKLGFINFDEEQLDTPSFLRKDKETTTDGPDVSA
ncbi:MAG: hypothetical protein WCG27_00070, partial [Pseudomonadota bacterium]